MRYKLFVWHGVLCEHGCGHIAVIAKNLERARELALMSIGCGDDKHTIKEKEPDIYDMKEEAVILCHGSG